MSIVIKNLSYSHPDKENLFHNITFSIETGEKVAIVGQNGVGKSTLLRILAGTLQPDNGDITCADTPYYVPQHFGQFDQLNVAQALGIEDKLKAFQAILQGDAAETNFSILNDDWTIEERALNALAQWGLQHIEWQQPMSMLSGGEKTKVFLSGVAIHEPSVILLDEPTNHLDTTSREQLYTFIRQNKATVLVVSHDRKLLNLLHTIYELNTDAIDVYGGNYEFYKQQKELKLQLLLDGLDEKERELRKARKAAREAAERQQKHSVRGEKANAKKGVPRIAMGNLKSKSENTASKLKGINEEKITNIVTDLKALQENIPTHKNIKVNVRNTALHKGKILVTLDKVNFAYTDRFLWNEPVNGQLISGNRLLIKGNNGSGKSTLIKLMLGKLSPQQGKIKRSDFTSLYIDQEYSIINNKLTVFEQLEQFNTQKYQEHELKMFLHRFSFTSGSWDKPCVKLSGGEKMKLVFCCLQVHNDMPDVFALDEPTNNLDIQSIEIITSALQAYQGTVILISHDEYFINEVGVNQWLMVNG